MNNLKSVLLNVLKTLTCIIFLCFSNLLFSQTPTVQDCLGAIPICEEIYSESNSPVGQGNYTNEILGWTSGGACCMNSEDNSIWYTFTVNQSGNFGFTLTPNNIADDYDWVLFNITNKSCADIASDPSMQVSCNVAGSPTGIGPCNGITGANGGSIYDNQGGGCGSNPPSVSAGFTPDNALVPVQQGNTYVLLITNWTGSTFGYTIDFGVSGNIGIFDQIDPEIAETVTPGDCGGNEFEVTFSENIQCSTIDGFNFEISGPSGPFLGTVSVSSNSCSQGGEYDNVFTVTTDPPLDEAGTYTITLINNSSEVLDLCDNPAISSNFSFNVISPPLTDLQLGNDTLLCEGETLTLDATTGNALTYQWDGGPNTATYEVAQTGTYTVTVTNDCNSLIDNITVNVVPTPAFADIDLGNDTILCQGALYDLDATWTAGSEYTWQDGFDGAVYTVSQPGVYEVNVQGFCGETGTSSITVIYEDIPMVELGNDTIICEGEILNFDVTAPFVNSYMWQDGTTTPTYEISQTGNYNITMVSNCVTITDNIFVNVVPIGVFDVELGNDTMLCPGELLPLDATWSSGIEYLWQDGSTTSTYTVSEAGLYEVEVLGACGEMGTAMIEVLYDTTQLRLDLGEDRLLCEEDIPIRLDAYDPNAEQYLWQDGSMGSFFQIDEGGTYSVTLSDKCNVVTDEVVLDFTNCTICEVYVPNAFSPDFNGYNDYFRPYSNCVLENYSMKIFNRWGALVFESSDVDTGWDGKFNGKDTAEGVYVYLFEFQVNQMGETLDRQLSGDVTVTK